MITTLLAALIAPQDLPNPTIPATPPGRVIELSAADSSAHTRPEDTARLTPYLPPLDIATGTAVLVLPGGGYAHLAAHEGQAYARWLNSLGIAAYVLEYRLGGNGHPHPAPLIDAVRALEWIRADTEFPVEPKKLGVIGSSAGGHLAATLAALDPESNEIEGLPSKGSRPSFAILCYPVISMRDPLAHAGSRHFLIGDTPSPSLVDRLSIELQVTAAFSPTFLWHTADDPTVSVRNSYALADALARFHVPHELHVFEHGRHGIGLGFADPSGHAPSELHAWTGACAEWLGRDFGRKRVTLDGGPSESGLATRGFVVRADGGRIVVRVTDGVDVLPRGFRVACYRGETYKGDLRIDGAEDGDLLATPIRSGAREIVPGDRFTWDPK